VEWYDVDQLGVIELREQLYPRRPHTHMIAASVTDPSWISRIPVERPVLVIGEGLTMYLTEFEGVSLLRRIVDQFDSGEMQFDVFSRAGISMQWMNGVVRRSGSTLRWGIDGPDELLEAVPGLRLIAAESVFDSSDFSRLSTLYRVMSAAWSLIPPLKRIAQYHRYGF